MLKYFLDIILQVQSLDDASNDILLQFPVHFLIYDVYVSGIIASASGNRPS